MVRRFVVVGAFGFLVQIATFVVLSQLGWPWMPATVVAVEMAIAHNFAWHRSWTWRDRVRSRQSRWLTDFLRFNAGTALTSIAGNVGVMAAVLKVVHLEPILANILAVGAMSVVNFLLADRWVFRNQPDVAWPGVLAPPLG